MRAVRSMLLAVADEPLPELDLLYDYAQLVTFEPEEPVIRQDEDSPYLYYVVRGLARVEAYQGGQPVVLGIREEGEIIGDIAAMHFRAVQRMVDFDLHPRSRTMPSRSAPIAALSITAIEPCVLLRMDSRIIVELAERHLAWSRVVLAIIVVNTFTRRAEFTQMRSTTPAASYAALLVERPQLVRRITQRELARLLGVSEAGMSRIAKRVHGRGVTKTDAPSPDFEGAESDRPTDQ